MTNKEEIKSIMGDYDAIEIEARLDHIFNGYLGCDTGDAPEELQQNHHLIRCIVEVFREIERRE